MANLNYPGETWKITGLLTDSQEVAIAFADVVSMTIKVFDKRGVSVTYSKADGQIVVGDTSNSYALEIPASDTILFTHGKLKGEFTIEFPSVDFSGNAIDRVCLTLLQIGRC